MLINQVITIPVPFGAKYFRFFPHTATDYNVSIQCQRRDISAGGVITNNLFNIYRISGTIKFPTDEQLYIGDSIVITAIGAVPNGGLKTWFVRDMTDVS